ncbi:hypothetical protein Bhyg_01310 [Pseudolycoriella hygida]|uniref:DUF389 domain-containing protein n=1 Tax=Pseudolycoriella hygida TaxID=35572 RepID=A0A9Q0S793_9DIPT|nr:hypothetical protein Bhyg_01310 [Pseudolycoriella hygida]
MSGTLFIVCIPAEVKDEAPREKSNKNGILFNKNRSTERLKPLQQQEILIEIEDFDCNGQIQKSPKLERAKSCDIIFRKTPNSEEGAFLRQSLNASRSKSCEKKTKKLKEFDDLDLNISPNSSMKLILNKILEKCQIKNAIWNQGNGVYIVTFSIPNGDLHENVLKLFKCWGIGERPGSSVTMSPCTVIVPTSSSKEYDDDVIEQGLVAKDQGIWDGFINSVNARMNVAKIVEELRQDAALTFDFVVLIIIAGIMAAFGLIENSIICLTSSMLISPLMGPLIAATFSTVIKDKQLMKFGVINELIGICLATLVGFVFGLIVGSVDERYGVGDGLGDEILSRCDVHSLIIGVFTAIPSGAAVAIAILGEKIASLVGVAISASILPPAVNAGLLWALALLFMIHKDDEDIYNSVIKSTTYSQNQAVELAILGSMSMTITLINIVSIYVTGILFLKIKEVAPMSSKLQQKFWKHDVKVARDYNKTFGTVEGETLKESLLAELVQLQEKEFRTVTNKTFSCQNTWSPMMRVNKSTRMSMQELEKLYWDQSFNKTKIHPANRLNRVAAICKSISPPKYQPLTEDVENNFQFVNGNWHSSATSSSQQILIHSKTDSGFIETPRKSRFNGEIRSCN